MQLGYKPFGYKKLAETKIVCEACKCWVGRLPNYIGNSLKSEQMAIDAGWFGVWCSDLRGNRARRLWYCPSCAKKTSVKEMVDSV
jgi:hypothetical protein